jgi:hypothetical protein
MSQMVRHIPASGSLGTTIVTHDITLLYWQTTVWVLPMPSMLYVIEEVLAGEAPCFPIHLLQVVVGEQILLLHLQPIPDARR